VGLGVLRPGMICCGEAGEVRRGGAGCGGAGCGVAEHGLVRYGMARRGRQNKAWIEY